MWDLFMAEDGPLTDTFGCLVLDAIEQVQNTLHVFPAFFADLHVRDINDAQ